MNILLLFESTEIKVSLNFTYIIKIILFSFPSLPIFINWLSQVGVVFQVIKFSPLYNVLEVLVLLHIKL